ncbi:MAG: hypothetical protein IJ934_03120 [Acetobacter sp.]|nr:hypothetical protein [Acetobacter sp.]
MTSTPMSNLPWSNTSNAMPDPRTDTQNHQKLPSLGPVLSTSSESSSYNNVSGALSHSDSVILSDAARALLQEGMPAVVILTPPEAEPNPTPLPIPLPELPLPTEPLPFTGSPQQGQPTKGQPTQQPTGNPYTGSPSTGQPSGKQVPPLQPWWEQPFTSSPYAGEPQGQQPLGPYSPEGQPYTGKPTGQPTEEPIPADFPPIGPEISSEGLTNILENPLPPLGTQALMNVLDNPDLALGPQGFTDVIRANLVPMTAQQLTNVLEDQTISLGNLEANPATPQETSLRALYPATNAHFMQYAFPTNMNSGLMGGAYSLSNATNTNLNALGNTALMATGIEANAVLEMPPSTLFQNTALPASHTINLLQIPVYTIPSLNTQPPNPDDEDFSRSKLGLFLSEQGEFAQNMMGEDFPALMRSSSAFMPFASQGLAFALFGKPLRRKFPYYYRRYKRRKPRSSLSDSARVSVAHDEQAFINASYEQNHEQYQKQKRAKQK